MTKRRKTVNSMVMTALFAALITVGALIPPIPVGALPITLQTLTICITAGLLGAKWGSAAVGLYIALGAIGLPVFTGGQGGIGVLFGATGGYIVGFLALTLVIGLFTQRFGRKFWSLIVGMAVGMIACYAIGTVWFVAVYTDGDAVTFGQALTMCVLPFILPDALKITLAAVLVSRLGRHIRVNG